MGALIRSITPATGEQSFGQTVFCEFLSEHQAPLDPRAFRVLASRAQAQAMIDHDRGAQTADGEWSAFFIECMVEYLVWTHPQAGRLAADDLDWLESEAERGASANMGGLLFALVRELNEVPERLMVLALRHTGNRRAALH